MRSIRTTWTILVGNHQGTIPVEFGQIPISGLRKEVVWNCPYIIEYKIVTPRGEVNFDPSGMIRITLVEDLSMMLYTKYEISEPFSFRQEDIFKLNFENLLFDHLTYLSNELKWFEQLW